ncbi:MAG: FAD-dependent oxidoreductase [Microscillaceae bacterium]|jgi:monoamine oxidase|nr:FAD-dependent oxidoreductase [Microscillaceae bacterium]
MSLSKDKNTRICIIGGGAGGLSAAYFLTKQGYKNVTVLERDGEIGGKCNSITYAGKSFDLGANYITSSYHNVKKMAREVKAKMYTEGRLRAYNLEKQEFTTLLKAVTAHTSIFVLGWQSLRYIWKRWRLNKIISTQRPGYAGIAQHPELAQSLSAWLAQNKLSGLKTMFQIPISLMGYGNLDEIPAMYALTYMNLGTFINLAMAAINPRLLGYPKRFTEGYQRFWERIAWQLNVIHNAEIHQVSRHNGIKVDLSVHEQVLNEIKSVRRTMEFDYLILATPLNAEVLTQFMTDLSPQELKLFNHQNLQLNPFVVVTYRTRQMADFTAATFMLPEPPLGQPFVVTRQFADNDLVSFYTRTTYENPISKAEILQNIQNFVKDKPWELESEYYTYDDFPYFPHVDSETIKNGFYDELEDLQGQNRTFYVGGLLNFELVETITNYSKHLIGRFFPKVNH